MTPPGCLWAIPPLLIGFLFAWLLPLWVAGGMTLLKLLLVPVLRFAAVTAFILAALEIAPYRLAMLPIGLALWCVSTLWTPP